MPKILTYNSPPNIEKERIKQPFFKSFFDWFSSLHKFDKLFLIIVLLVVVATPYIVSNSLNFNPEAKGRVTATLTVSPNPVPLATSFTVYGSGFKANTTVYVGPQGYFQLTPVTTTSQGTFSYQYPNGISVPGTYTFVALVQSRKTWETAASTTLTVQ